MGKSLVTRHLSLVTFFPYFHPRMSSPLLQIKNLTTEFTSDGVKTTAVKGISFNLNKGETVGIVGESGSGKSVTSLSVMRLIASPPGKIAGGEIIYHIGQGKDVNLLSLPVKEM